MIGTGKKRNPFRRICFPLLCPVLLCLSGCGREEPPPEKPAAKTPQRPPPAVETAPGSAVPAAPWAAKPKNQWPQIVLTNHAKFKGHTPLDGASAFLLKAPRGPVLAATARHLIGENGGVNPEIALPDLNAVLDTWIMHPRTRPEDSISIAGLASPSNAPRGFDWLLLRIAPGKDTVPFVALEPRATPVKTGDRVHLIGVSYDEPGVAQKVYSGKVTRRDADLFAYDLDTPVNIRGFSGAPIVDDAGALVGVMTIWFEPRMKGDFYLEAGGEDAATVRTILKKMAGG